MAYKDKDWSVRKNGLRYGYFYRMADIIPAGSRGKVEVRHFDITEKTWQGFGTELTAPGRYASLHVNGVTVMSDTDMELRTNLGAVMDARGDVLIGGLGLGMITLPIVFKPEVKSVTVVEINEDVLGLVWPGLDRKISLAMSAQTGRYYRAKLNIIAGDINKWRPEKKGRQFDYIYFDIWSDMCVDHVEEMKELHLAFRHYLRPGGKVSSWQYEHLRWLKRQGRWR